MKMNSSRLKLMLFLFVLLEYQSNRLIDCRNDDSKYYHRISIDNFCFLRLNATHQIGCSDSKFDNTGFVHLISNESELNNFVNNQSSTSIAVVPVIFLNLFNFDTLSKFKKSNHVAGVIVMDNSNDQSSSINDDWFSSDKSCPNENFDLYVNNSDYNHCKKIQWNQPLVNNINNNHMNGLLFEHWPFPIFLMRNKTEIQWLLDKINEYKDWPNLMAELESSMFAAVNSVVCSRRTRMSRDSFFSAGSAGLCEPLGGINIYTHTFQLNETKDYLIADDSVLVLATRLDTFSMFDGIAPGADSVMSSLMTIIAISELLFRPHIFKELVDNNNGRSLFVALFDGEAFDYMGSSFAALQMQEKKFLLPKKNFDKQPSGFDLNKISKWIEFEQIGMHDYHSDSNDVLQLYLHKNPENNKNDNDLIRLIQSMSESFNDLQINTTPNDMPLPPSSVQSFLKIRNIDHVVITNHRDKFKNKHYNSMFDTGAKIMNSTDLKSLYAKHIKSISTLFARVVFKLITDKQLNDSEVADNNLISMLMECLLYNSNCKLYRKILGTNIDNNNNNNNGTETDNVDEENTVEPPYPSYVSVFSVGIRFKILREYINRILNYYTGEKLFIKSDECDKLSKSDPYHTYIWQSGQTNKGECVYSNMFTGDSISPGFDFKTFDISSENLKTQQYAVWTESKWGPTLLKFYVKPNPLQKYLIFALGCFIALISFSIVILFKKSNFLQTYFPDITSSLITDNTTDDHFVSQQRSPTPPPQTTATTISHSLQTPANNDYQTFHNPDGNYDLQSSTINNTDPIA